MHRLLGVLLQALNHFVSLLHSRNAHFVLLSTFLNLQIDLSNIQILVELFVEPLFLGFNHLFFLHCEIILHLHVDVRHTLFSMGLNESDHGTQDIVSLALVHLL